MESRAWYPQMHYGAAATAAPLTTYNLAHLVNRKRPGAGCARTCPEEWWGSTGHTMLEMDLESWIQGFKWTREISARIPALRRKEPCTFGLEH